MVRWTHRHRRRSESLRGLPNRPEPKRDEGPEDERECSESEVGSLDKACGRGQREHRYSITGRPSWTPFEVSETICVHLPGQTWKNSNSL